MAKRTDITPSARRLITSMRDLGYEFTDAVAELVDNSIQAGSSVIQVNLHFDGTDSYLTVMDNGHGMTHSQLVESMRFGSIREYLDDDLGKFGLGLKTSSLSQCDILTVSTRCSSNTETIHSYCWSIEHITKVDKWEIIPVDEEDLLNPVLEHLNSTVGTVVTWERLNRLLSFRDPNGWRAENHVTRLIHDLKLSLGTTFHRYLTGEQRTKRVVIFVNGEIVEAWDPFCRSEMKTQELDSFSIPVSVNDIKAKIEFRPFVLPHQSAFSSHSAHVKAGGRGKWNKQQGFYIYRAGRLLQSGGWCGLRTSDEHSKLTRVIVEIPAGLDHLFKVNIAKMKVNFPREIRQDVMTFLTPIIKFANDVYRSHGSSKLEETSSSEEQYNASITELKGPLDRLDTHWGFREGTIRKLLPKFYTYSTRSERDILLKMIRRIISEKK